ncbi:MAG: class I SAM-dependent methyltransferase [Actinomycetota bacterium]
MPHKKNKVRRQASRNFQRNQKRIQFLDLDGSFIQDSPIFYESPEFRLIRKNKAVIDFIQGFWKWNEEALCVMSNYSHPNISMQEMLVNKLSPYLGEVLVDLGCGAGNFYGRLFPLSPMSKKTVKKIFAVDIDWESLSLVPHNLKKFGWQGRVALIQSSTLSELPVWDNTADAIVSSIGGLTYSGWRFDQQGQLICEGRQALISTLTDCNRILKSGGYLGFSSLRPKPNFEMVLWDSLSWPVLNFKWKSFWEILLNGFHIKNISQFLHKAEREQHAQYLSIEEWTEYLEKTGFEVIDVTIGECYAGQGVTIIARKI